jgi:hypothetical protein
MSEMAYRGPDSTPLTEDERRDLQIAEETIRGGLTTFRAVGAALLAIRDRRLYRQEHDSFESYCRQRWGLTPRRGYQLIRAVQVAEDLDVTPPREVTVTAVVYQPETERPSGSRSTRPTSSPPPGAS